MMSPSPGGSQAATDPSDEDGDAGRSHGLGREPGLLHQNRQLTQRRRGVDVEPLAQFGGHLAGG
ncbi:MAG: hypothetical protein WBO89_05495, partial [Propionicimonas sp.]